MVTDALALPAVEVPAPPSVPTDLKTRVTQRFVYVYRTGAGIYAIDGENARLVAVWRWSRIRRRLVPGVIRQDRADWAPEWSRDVAEAAWRETH